MSKLISLAIETTCRRGGLALGEDGEMVERIMFDASHRHAVQIVGRMDELLKRHRLAAGDVGELYVSAGPGSFTGTRIGITVARTMAQAVAGLKTVSVPTAHAVALNAEGMEWRNLGVVMASKDDQVYACLFARQDGGIVQQGSPAVLGAEELLGQFPRPILLIGEALDHVDLSGEGVTIGPSEAYLPDPAAVWKLGRQAAIAGNFTEAAALLPIYPRKPEAQRLWEKNH
ncbi:MAG: tRNA (adenosine(37)-N6)-threonylcarbamoyltransferase complex dimerization subunit type 1 TsaB [Planctomycetes bacterium]|nr:tRNA (adenosine(37)-N6)-threonylcarbamoyltransferase complex dimerization subunit type 1 TsaB [Planctomycetota bacterium]